MREEDGRRRRGGGAGAQEEEGFSCSEGSRDPPSSKHSRSEQQIMTGDRRGEIQSIKHTVEN